MRRTRGLVAALTSVLVFGVLAPATAAGSVTSMRPAHAVRAASVDVRGSVTTPTALTGAELAALPQTTLPLQGRRGATGTVTGVAVPDALAPAGPLFDGGKNAALRASVTVAGVRDRAVTFAYGELDPGFGNHPALLTVRGSRIDLVVPGDSTRARTVAGVQSITLTDLAAPVSTPAAGAVQVTDGRRTVTVSAALLHRLPAHAVTVTFSAAGAPQQHTESGPSLALVELVAGFLPASSTVVTAVGSDGYGAVVTNGEGYFGGRPLLLSLAEDGTTLAQPRLVADGDVKGGRYVSGVVTLSLTR